MLNTVRKYNGYYIGIGATLPKFSFVNWSRL